MSIAYQRLPGSSRKSFGLIDPGKYRLYLAPDHLLFMCIRPYSESCKRFFLKDIQALVLSKTHRSRDASLALGILIAICLAVSLVLFLPGFLRLQGDLTFGPNVGALISGSLALLFLIPLLVNLALGPSCKCLLQTAVQTEEIVCLGRWRSAQKTLEILLPLIAAAQGRVAPEELQIETAAPRSEPAAADSAPFVETPPPLPPEQAALRHEPGHYHLALFGMLLVWAADDYLGVDYHNRVKHLIGLILMLPYLFLLVMSLTKQRNSDLPQGIKTITWAALAAAIGAFLFSSIYTMVYTLSRLPEMAKSNPLDFHLETPVFQGFKVVEAITQLVLGLIGLALLNRFRSAARPAPAPAAETEGAP